MIGRAAQNHFGGFTDMVDGGHQNAPGTVEGV